MPVMASVVCVHAIVFIDQIYEFYEFTPWKMVKFSTWIFIVAVLIAHVYDELGNNVLKKFVITLAEGALLNNILNKQTYEKISRRNI